MSMEFFAWPWAEYFFGPTRASSRYTHLSGALTFIPLRHDGGPLPAPRPREAGMSPAERNEAWRELTAVSCPGCASTRHPLLRRGPRLAAAAPHLREPLLLYRLPPGADRLPLSVLGGDPEGLEGRLGEVHGLYRPAGTKTFQGARRRRGPRLALRRGGHAHDRRGRRQVA